MKRVGKPVFFVVAILMVVFLVLSLTGISTTYGDRTDVYIKGGNDIRWGIDIRGGVDVTFTMRKTGEILKPHVSGHGRRLCGNCDKITFDTAAAEAISNSFYEDGVNEFNADGEAAELYVDSEGRYFMAEYHTDTSKDRLRTVQSSVAAAFVEKYGTQIEKGPKKE